MSKNLEVFDNKRTSFEGLWWHAESNCFTSAVISLAQLRKFKGNVRMVVKKNQFYNGGENGRPNYIFSLYDAKSDNPVELEVQSECNESGERMYSREEVQYAIDRAAEDGRRGYFDNIVKDYL